MKFHVLTLFPEMILQGLAPSIIGRAAEKELISLNAVNIRDFSTDKHNKVDDYPYGGGAGMLMQAQPVYDAWKSICGDKKLRCVYLTPQGTPFTQSKAKELAGEEELIFLCGHYEGIDQRVLDEIVTDQVSIGDYVLTGGELPAMVMIDAIARLVPGVLGNDASSEDESFYNDLLEYPQFTRPEVWHDKKVPEVLMSGNHRKVTEWRLEQSVEKTKRVRPDLYARYEEKQRIIKQLSKQKRNHIHMMESLSRGRGEVLVNVPGELLIYDREACLCMIWSKANTASDSLLAAIPDACNLIVVMGTEQAEQLCGSGWMLYNKCSQYLYTAKENLPVRYKDIRPAVLSDVEYMSAHYDIEGYEYLIERVQAGMMYTAVDGEKIIGFMGVHSEGSMGLLYVDEGYRGRGVAASLEAYVVNKCLERGWTPYGHVIEGNEASDKLQDKLGLYKADKKVIWLGR